MPNIGIYDVEIIPAKLTSAPGKWIAGVNSFSGGLQGWAGINARITPCGAAQGATLQTASGTRTTIAFRTFTGLPADTAIVRVQMVIFFTHAQGAQEASVYVNNARIWDGTQQAGAGTCDQRPKMIVDAYARVGSDGVAGVFVWGAAEAGAAIAIDDVEVTPLQLGIGDWTGETSDFTAWSDGWGGTGIATTNCGELVMNRHCVLLDGPRPGSWCMLGFPRQ